MINLNELETTSLITIIHEIRNTNKLLDDIDLLMATKKLQPHEVENCIHTLNEQERYYRVLEEEIMRRGWYIPEDHPNKVRYTGDDNGRGTNSINTKRF